MDKIKKRNGTYAAFDPAKIQTAIMKANVRVAEEPMTEEDLSFLTQRVVKKLEKENEIPDVEHIQDIVERTLSKAGYSRTAKAYILYRAEHAKMREMRDTLPEIFSNLTFKAASEVDMKRENANINTDTAMGTMLKFGTESAKDYFDKFILPPHIAQADHDGDIHIHDKDFYTITETCCQIDLLKLFKDGFSTGHGYLREPNSIRSYAALACIAIQANQNEMHGGQAVPNFDFAMADGVRKTYRKSFLKHLAETLENKGVWPVGTGYQGLKKMDLTVPTLGQANEQKWPNVFDNKIHETLNTYDILIDEDYRRIARRAYTDTVDETHQAMEAVIHNLNSMHCYGENSSIWAYNHETKELNTVTVGEICRTFKPKKWSVFAVNPHTGITELKYITAVQKVGNHRDMVTIKTKTGQKTRMTTNHRMITLDENANIVERYPDETALALAPKGIKLPENHAPVHDLWKYCKQCGKPYANSPKTARYISITPELAELFGYYVADGSVMSSQTTVVFTVCDKIKGEHLKRLMDKAFDADFTMHPKYYTTKTGENKIQDCRFNAGTHVAQFFKDMCGENAASKKVPQDILQGNKDLFQIFYNAYIACDGHNAKTINFSSVSKKLRDQINMLCMAYGELPAYNECVKRHPTKNAPCPKQYQASLNRTGAQHLGIDVINKPQVTLPKYNLTIATQILRNNGVKWGSIDCGRIPFRKNRQIHHDELQNVMTFHNKTFGLSHLLNLYPIDIIEKTYDNSGNENVYDITVEDYENFLTDECIFVHNSRAGAQVPFSSINYGTDTSPEGQLAIREILNATEDGLGNGETPIFPVQIFKVKEGVNYNPGDPNYSLLKQAMRVSAKRLFPNFSFMDAPFNKQYLGKHPDKPWYDEVGYMGCVLCTEVLTYKVGNMLKVHSIGRAWNEFSKTHSVQKYGESEFIDLENDDVTVWDSHTKGFVKVKKWIKNPNKNNWFQLKLSSGRKLIATADHPLPTKEHGRCFIKDLTLSDQIPITSTQYSPETKITPDFNTDFAWLLGVLLCDSSYAQNIMISLGNDEKDIEQQITNVIKNIPDYKFSTYTIQQNRSYKGSYRDINIKCGTKLKPFKEWLTSFFGGRRKLDRQIPDEIFSWPDEYKHAFIAGMMDADGYIDSKGTSFLGSTNHELATQQMLLLQSISIPAKCYINHYTKNKNATRLAINFTMTDGIIEHMQSRKKVKADEHYRGKPQVIKEFASIISIEALDIDQPSYDIETESDRFDVSGILSHNCRTRVMANVYDPENEITPGRGNLSFTSINLPRIAIQSRNMVNEKGEFNSPTNMEKFYRILDERIDLCIEQLLHRFKIQCSKHAYNYPFLMGEGVWINSEKLSPADTLENVLKHGTLSVGFIGLAETLVALTGKHHGESEESWKLGYEIIKYMRERMDQACKKYKLNLSLLATPGEGLSGTFVRIDKKKYGIIPGVTDREYYTNSFHVPVYYNISAFDKIKKEAPFHELTNAGHISYVEVDGDIAKNLDAFEAIVRCMKESGIGYGSINHPVDRDPICGYVGIINEVCPRCGRRENEAVSLEKLEELKKKYRNMPDITKYIK